MTERTIDRLLELRLSAFRAFGGEETVPLDADVILVHGPNGHGKSTLLAALELAITGRVEDLEEFKDDYPRCLRHVSPESEETGSTEVELRYRSGDEALALRRRIQPKPGRKKGLEVVGLDGDEPAEGAKYFFEERAYLSQRGLGRLLELYQKPDEESRELPLVGVLRKLLGLDRITRLDNGLDAVLDIRRLRKKSTALQRLEAEEKRLVSDREGWEERKARLREDLHRRLEEIGDLAVLAGHRPEGLEVAALEADTIEKADLETIASTLDALEIDLDAVDEALARSQRLRGAVDALRRLPDSPEVSKILAEIAGELEVEASFEAVAEACEGEETRCLERRRELREAERERLRARLFLERAAAVRDQLLEALAQENLFEERATRLQEARDRFKAVRELAKEVHTAAIEVEGRFAESVFVDRLNRFANEFFGRLAPHEPFRPYLSKPESKWNRLRVSTGARLGESEENAFEQAGAIFSSGNLNTAALTLFIALHFLEEPAAKMLVIDDPVQAMDDVHIVQLSALLRAIARGDQPRQLVLAVHERALFDYLRLELGPTREGDSLLAVEVDRVPGTTRSTVRHERDVWQPDQVRFG